MSEIKLEETPTLTFEPFKEEPQRRLWMIVC